MRWVLVTVLVVAAVLVALAIGARRPAGESESFVSGTTVGFQIDRGSDPEVVAALDGLTGTVQWMACVPAYQLLGLLKKQADTGLTTIKADTVLENLRARKTSALAAIQRLGVSPTFKSQLIQFAEYTLSSFSDIVKTLQNADGFIDLQQAIEQLKQLAEGYCSPPVGGANFGQGNNFIPA